ncbi:MAG: hypothetical protein WA445_28010, partial [Pseudolabrys sp.]
PLRQLSARARARHGHQRVLRISGVLFFLISVFPIRQYVIDAIPQNLKLAVSAGVGLFLGIIALEEARL